MKITKKMLMVAAGLLVSAIVSVLVYFKVVVIVPEDPAQDAPIEADAGAPE